MSWSRIASVIGAWAAGLLVLAPAHAAAAGGEAPPPIVVWVALGGETFSLELAADPAARHRGLSGRSAIARNAGMLFVLPHPERFAMVMRDCAEPLDVAFLDARGRVVALHEMRPEPPRRADESPFQYEQRLPSYTSGEPVQFAVETAGGRLRELGIAPGDRIPLDTEGLVRRAR
jgi:uncharacterized membrane protein (UPF0127 family)